jgi:hypothetical protein
MTSPEIQNLEHRKSSWGAFATTAPNPRLQKMSTAVKADQQSDNGDSIRHYLGKLRILVLVIIRGWKVLDSI